MGVSFRDRHTAKFDDGPADHVGMGERLRGFLVEHRVELETVNALNVGSVVRVHGHGAHFPAQGFVEAVNEDRSFHSPA